jgi:hypothetical protein
MAVTIDSITTGDAVPSTTPHKISQQTGKDSAAVKFTPSTTVAAYELRIGGVDQSTGTLIERAGRLQVGRFKCGAGKTVSSKTFKGQQTVAITYSESGGGADGTRTINVWEHPPDGGWD